MPKGIREIRSAMCDEGWHVYFGGANYDRQITAKPNPFACVECESTCQGGMLYLELMPEEEFQALLCGGDCYTCRQPCNLCSIVRKRAKRAAEKKKRLQHCGQWRQFRTMQSWIKTMINALSKTREVFRANLCNQQLRVVNKTAINTTKDMTVVLTDDLYWLITDELHNHCAICMGCGEDMRGCEFHKRLKRMTMFELDERGGVCMGKQLEAKGE